MSEEMELRRSRLERIKTALYAVDRSAEWNGDGRYTVAQKPMAQISEAIDCVEALIEALSSNPDGEKS